MLIVVGFSGGIFCLRTVALKGMDSVEDFERVKRLLGERIGRRRNKVGLTQENLAHLAQVNRSHLSDIETGKSAPGVWTLIRISAVLGTTPARLLRGLRWTPTEDVADYLKDPAD